MGCVRALAGLGRQWSLHAQYSPHATSSPSRTRRYHEWEHPGMVTVGRVDVGPGVRVRDEL